MFQTRRLTVVVATFVVAVAAQATGAFAGCGDYLHVRGEKTAMASHGSATVKVAKQNSDAANPHAVLSRHAKFDDAATRSFAGQPPIETPCDRGECDSQRLPILPVAPGPSRTVDCNDVAIAHDDVRNDAKRSAGRLRTCDNQTAVMRAESIDRPPE